MEKVKSTIFREYDIRGIVNKDLNSETVKLIGKGIGTAYRKRSIKQVAIGMDCRLSSPSFSKFLAEGLQSTGCDVIFLGTIPTPLLYFSIFYKNFESGVMITGSHNPAEYNGFKLMAGKEALFGKDIQDIYRLIVSGDLIQDSTGKSSFYDIAPEYEDYLLKNIHLQRKLKVVVDAGNGTGGVIAVPIFRKLGCEVKELYCNMDGNFPNHHPDPTLPEALEDLIQTVKESNADLGISYDGDSDRIGVIDDKGNILWGDQLMILFSRSVLADHPGASIISEVKSSQILYDEIARLGGRPIMWKTGHSLIKKKIKQENSLLAGEMSGHIFFADKYFGFDDAIYSSARLLEILSQSNKSLSFHFKDLPQTFSTPEIRIYASDKVKFQIVDKVKKELEKKHPINDIDGVRASFPDGWALVRASNTQEVLVLRYESKTEEGLNQIRKEVEKTVENIIKNLDN